VEHRQGTGANPAHSEEECLFRRSDLESQHSTEMSKRVGSTDSADDKMSPRTAEAVTHAKGGKGGDSASASRFMKLVMGAGGIYAAFLYYGTLQEDVFHYKAADGSAFKAAWFLQALGERLNRNIGFP
jgi:hypothetical protein